MPPSLTGARNAGNTTIVLEFNEIVQLGNVEATCFSLVDGLGNPVTVNSVADMSQEDNELELLTEDFSMAIGDLQVTYNDDGDADRVLDYGSNFLADGSTTAVDLDTELPTISSAARSGFEVIVVTFSEPINISVNEGADFTVRDAVGTAFLVGSSIGDIVLQDNQLELAVANFSGAVGDLTLTLYTCRPVRFRTSEEMIF